MGDDELTCSSSDQRKSLRGRCMEEECSSRPPRRDPAGRQATEKRDAMAGGARGAGSLLLACSKGAECHGCWRLKTTEKTARRGKHRLEKWRLGRARLLLSHGREGALGKLQGADGHGGGAAPRCSREEEGDRKKRRWRLGG
jgi:hypothetical protein